MTDKREERRAISFKIAEPKSMKQLRQVKPSFSYRNGTTGQRKGSGGERWGPFCLQRRAGSLLQQVIREWFIFQPLMEGGRTLMLSFNVFMAKKNDIIWLVLELLKEPVAASEPISLICIF